MKNDSGKHRFRGLALVCAAAGLLALFCGCEQPAGGGSNLPRYTISFESHGGSAVAAITVNEGTAVNKPADPARSDYTFTGWYSAETGGTLYSWPYTVNGNVTMHAQWRDDSQPPPAQYTITFNSHGGSAVQSLTVNEGTAVNKPADPSRNGYVFSGWYSAETGGTLYSWPCTVNGNVTMHAQWTAITYTLTYNLNGGTNNSTNPVNYTIENAAITLAAPTRAGYSFGGWYDNGTFTGTAVTEIPANSTGDKTFHARWTATNYTITYNLNGGTNNAANPAAYTIESAAITLADPARSGYSFGGWYSDAAFTAAVTGIPSGSTGDKTFYAKWTAESYTIT